MKRSPTAGNDRELRVMEWLVSWGWLCGHRRHIGGAGDILAVRHIDLAAIDRFNNADPLGDNDLILVEVKSTGRPYDHFPPLDRQAMRSTAEAHRADAWLAWWPAYGKLAWLHESQWPGKPTAPEPLFQTEPRNEGVARDLPEG